MINREMVETVRRVVEMLVSGDYIGLERLSAGRRLSSTDLKRAVEEYGRKLAPLPEESYADLEVIEVLGSMPRETAIDVDLCDEGEGRSDLTLTLTLRENQAGGYDVEIDDLHVL